MEGSVCRRFLIVHPHIHNSFIRSELESLIGMFNTVCTVESTKIEKRGGTTVIFARSSLVDFLLDRAILISKVVLLADSLEDLKEEIEKRYADNRTYKVEVGSHIRKLPEGSKKIELEKLDSILESGTVRMSSPEVVVEILETEEKTHTGVLYGYSRRKEHLKYNLKKRMFLGTTSMDNEISFLMSNIAQIDRKSVVLDCFSGTGSVLLPSALLGAFVIGSDVNRRQFVGRDTYHKNPKIKTMAPGTDVYTNFKQFGVENKVLGFCTSDVFDGETLKPQTVDAVIFDPPYGGREGVQRGENRGAVKTETEDAYLQLAIPFVEEVLRKAEVYLKDGGRACFFVPHETDREPPVKTVINENFEEVSRSTQYLTSKYSRTLLLYRKK